MKKILCWMFASVLFCSSAAVLTSCDDDDVEDLIEAVNLVGTWNGSVESITPNNPDAISPMQGKLEFKSDGTFVDSDGETGSWTLKDKTVTMTYTDDGVTMTLTFTVLDGYTRNMMRLQTQTSLDGETVYTIVLKLTRQ